MPRRGLVLLATMGEADTIESVLQEVAESTGQMERFHWQFDVLIVDDGGDPAFRESCERLGRGYGLSIAVIDGPRAGLGAAILRGFDSALADPGVEYVVNLDADGQHDARQIGDLLRAHVANDADITIGSRWTRGGRCYGLSPARRVLSRASAFVLHFAGVPRHVKDPTTSFRVYNRETVELIRRELVGFTGFSFFGAAVSVASARGLSVIETPIIFRPRLGGNSKLRASQVTRAVRDLPVIRSVSGMVARRERGFIRAAHGSASPDRYNASRELEVLSNTPMSTRIILDELSPHIGGRVVEVGAGLGLVTRQLVGRGRSVTALEPDPDLYSRIGAVPDGAVVHNTTLAGLAGNDTFDTALYVNVLEHIADDAGELATVRGRLSPGGNVVIFVPAMPSLYGTMDEVSGHFRRYRRAELAEVLTRAGYEVELIRNFDAAGIVPYWLSYRVLRRATLGGTAVGLYDRVIIPVSRVISLLTGRRGPGKNLIAVASPRR